MDFKYPYTDYHELNLDWFLSEFKNLTETWARTQQDWISMQEYIRDYFDNLNVQTEIDNKINAMILDGTFGAIVEPFVTAALPAMVAGQLPDVVAAQIGAVVAAQIGAVVADQLPAVAAAAAAEEVGIWLAAHIDPDTGYVIDDTLTVSQAAADAKVVGDAITLLNSIAEDYRKNGYLALWTVGNINTSGQNVTSDKNLRTDAYISHNILSIDCTDTYNMAIATYNRDFTFVSRSSFNNRHITFDFDNYEYRIAVNRADSGDMNLTDLTGITVTTIDDKQTSDITELDARLTSIENDNNTLKVVSLFEWELGSINSQGQDSPSTAFSRTKSGVVYEFANGEKIQNLNDRAMIIHYYDAEGNSLNVYDTLNAGSTKTFTETVYLRCNINDTPPSQMYDTVITSKYTKVLTIINETAETAKNAINTFININIGELTLIPGTQNYGSFNYCSWPYNTAIYDSSDDSISIFYACKTSHASTDGVWITRKYHISTDIWDNPVVVASGEGLCFYGYAAAIDDDGNYIGLCKDDMFSGYIYICKSTDKGETWTKTQLIVDGSTIQGDCPCSLRKLSNGRWAFFLAIANKFIYSDDDMTTWHAISLNGLSATSYESEIIDFGNGKICLLVRNGGSGDTRYYPYLMISNNNGNTWENAVSMDWIDASAAPISAYYDDETKQIYLFHFSRYVLNGCLRFNITAVSRNNLLNNNGGQTKCVWKAESTTAQIGNTGYGAAVRVNDTLYYFCYKSVGSLSNNPKIYWSKMKINDVKLIS